jgi:parallel beta-helix repeat protein
MVGRALLIAALVAGFVLLRPAPSRAATLLVDDDALQCPAAPYRRIQDAIDAASAADTIEVCPGTYAEQLRIGRGKDGLTLRATVAQQAILRPPDALANLGSIGLVWVLGATNVTIEGLWIAGPFPLGACVASTLAGVIVEPGGSATVRRAYIADIRPADPALDRCSLGYGVSVTAAGAQAASVVVEESLIERYLTGGVLLDGSGASGTVARNRLLGDGPDAAGQTFGVEVRAGAAAAITDNDIGGHRSAAAEAVRSAGISLDRGAAGIRVEGNRVQGNDHGIALTQVTGATVARNQALTNTVYGIAAFAGARDNRFEMNQARESGTADCIDFTTGDRTAATANTWQGNDSRSAIPAGICGIP